MTQITLFYAPGTCARVPMTALEEAGVAFESRVVAFRAGEHRSPEFLGINPKGRVPALLIEGRALTENVAILPFLAGRYPAARLLPSMTDPWQQAEVLADLSFCASGLHPLVTRLRLPQNFCTLPEAPRNVWDLAAAAMRPLFQIIERRLDAGPWWYGEEWSCVDAYVNWVWFRVTGADFPVHDFPALAEHARRSEARPAVQRALTREAEGQAQLEARGLALVFKSADEAGRENDDGRLFASAAR